MDAFPLSISDYGDGALMVHVGAPDESERRQLIRRFRERVLAEPPPGVDDVVSGLESLLVEFDPLRTTAEQVAFALGALARVPAADEGAPTRAQTFVVPIVVSPDTAPDLDSVADELAVDPDDVIDRLERSELTVALLAAAMAPMLDGLDVPAPVRRRSTPRTDVPTGSVMIAGRNAIIQPFPGPTGWRVVGRTPLGVVDVSSERPVSFAPGDRFVFRRIDESAARDLRGRFLEPRP